MPLRRELTLALVILSAVNTSIAQDLNTFTNGEVINRFELEADEYFRVGEVVASGVLSQSFLTGTSRNRTTGELIEYQCSNYLSLQDVREIQKIFPPAELIEASYPLSVRQLP